MSKVKLKRLRVTGPGKLPAEVQFGDGLTLITGMSDTGKTHVVECIDYALAAGSAPERVPESEGYTLVSLELTADGAPHVIARALQDGDTASVRPGTLDQTSPPTGHELKVHISKAEPQETLSGWLLDVCGFDVHAPVVTNQRGKSQRLSFRNVAPFVIISEDDVIAGRSPVLSPQQIRHAVSRSVFQMLLTGAAPSPEAVAALEQAHSDRERAKAHVDLLEPIISGLRGEIRDAGSKRPELEAELQRIDTELAAVSERVSESGDHLRDLLRQRNKALATAESARRSATAAEELRRRFRLLDEHYRTDLRRLEFLLEGGHFFAQLSASHCPTCGREIDPDAACHPEHDDFVALERAARAEIGKLEPRLHDLANAVADASTEAQQAEHEATRARASAGRLDGEIRAVANPSAKTARARVKEITERRRAVEEELLRFRELDRYLQSEQEARAQATRKLDRYRPGQDLSALRSLSAEVFSLLSAWHFPLTSDVNFSTDTDDLVIDGKNRKAFGKGSRAVTHAAFTVGLMDYCLSASTPHPGFVIIDTPLTPFRGPSDDVEDPVLTRNVHTAFLYSLATTQNDAQAIIVENVDVPESIRGLATVHEFRGSEEGERAGFYP